MAFADRRKIINSFGDNTDQRICLMPQHQTFLTMNVLVVLIPISLILGGLGLAAFLWAVKSDQFDDAQGNAARILLDDE